MYWLHKFIFVVIQIPTKHFWAPVNTSNVFSWFLGAKPWLVGFPRFPGCYRQCRYPYLEIPSISFRETTFKNTPLFSFWKLKSGHERKHSNLTVCVVLKSGLRMFFSIKKTGLSLFVVSLSNWGSMLWTDLNRAGTIHMVMWKNKITWAIRCSICS